MKVSVSIVTHQQVDTVRQAVESALDQQTDFPFEVIVGDDASTDGTAEILTEMAREADGRMTVLHAPANYGDKGLSNVMATVDAATGEYIAFLDGDDYWTDPRKLQRQVDFLDAHPNCLLCSHRVTHLDERGRRLPSPRPARGTGEYDLGALLVRNFAPKLSTVVRRSAVGDLPDWYRTTRVASADWLFNVLISRSGRVGYIDATMAVHRVHAASLSAQYGDDHMLSDKLEMLRMLRDYLPGRERDFVRAERHVRWKRRIARLSPRAFRIMKQLNGLVR